MAGQQGALVGIGIAGAGAVGAERVHWAACVGKFRQPRVRRLGMHKGPEGKAMAVDFSGFSVQNLVGTKARIRTERVPESKLELAPDSFHDRCLTY